LWWIDHKRWSFRLGLMLEWMPSHEKGPAFTARIYNNHNGNKCFQSTLLFSEDFIEWRTMELAMVKCWTDAQAGSRKKISWLLGHADDFFEECGQHKQRPPLSECNKHTIYHSNRTKSMETPTPVFITPRLSRAPTSFAVRWTGGAASLGSLSSLFGQTDSPLFVETTSPV